MKIRKGFVTDDSGAPVRWQVAVDGFAMSFDHDPTDVEIANLLPEPEIDWIPPTGSTKKQLRESLDDAVLKAMSWDWMAGKAESLSHPAASSLRVEATRVGQLALQLANDWRSA